MVKVRCDICHAKIATWEYMPRGFEYYCDDCVPRGCSCNLIGDDDSGVEATDEQGRLLPCCEFGYSQNGWTANYLLTRGSPFKHEFDRPKWVNIFDIKYIPLMSKIHAKTNKGSFP